MTQHYTVRGQGTVNTFARSMLDVAACSGYALYSAMKATGSFYLPLSLGVFSSCVLGGHVFPTLDGAVRLGVGLSDGFLWRSFEELYESATCSCYCVLGSLVLRAWVREVDETCHSGTHCHGRFA